LDPVRALPCTHGNKLLDAFAGVCLAGVDIPFGVDGNLMDTVESRRDATSNTSSDDHRLERVGSEK
jgi:hypothetical protein